MFGALGVAVLGSILAQVYRDQLNPHLTALPASARDAAAGPITATQTVASKLGGAGARLDSFADAAFVHAMHVTTVISAVITLIGALVVLAWMPGRPAVRAELAEGVQPEETRMRRPRSWRSPPRFAPRARSAPSRRCTPSRPPSRHGRLSR